MICTTKPEYVTAFPNCGGPAEFVAGLSLDYDRPRISIGVAWPNPNNYRHEMQSVPILDGPDGTCSQYSQQPGKVTNWWVYDLKEPKRGSYVFTASVSPAGREGLRRRAERLQAVAVDGHRIAQPMPSPACAAATAAFHRREQPRCASSAPYPKNGYAKMTTVRSTRASAISKTSNNGLTRTRRPIRSIADGNIRAASCQRCARGAKRSAATAHEEAESRKCRHQPYPLRHRHAAARGRRHHPDPNIEPGCRDGEDGRSVEPGYDAAQQCLADERSARNELEKQWAKFSPAPRAALPRDH